MKKTVAAVLAIILMFSLCACGSKSASRYYETEAPAEVMYEESYYDYDTAGYYAAEYAAASETGVTGNGAAMKNESGDTGSEGNAQQAINPEKIIYSGYADVETIEFDDTVAKLEEMIRSCGGFIESSSFSDSSYWSKSHGKTGGRSAYYQIRVPSASFNDVMGGLTALGNVPSCGSSSTNVTSQYYDVQARLDAYLAQEARLLELYAAADTMEDLIAIEDRLADVRYNIERLQSTLNNYDRQVAYSTINLSVSEVAEYTPTVPVKQTFGEKFAIAVSDGFESALIFIQGLLIAGAESLPTLVIIAALLAVVIVIVKKLRAKGSEERKARREAKKAEKAAKKAAKMEEK